MDVNAESRKLLAEKKQIQKKIDKLKVMEQTEAAFGEIRATDMENDKSFVAMKCHVVEPLP